MKEISKVLFCGTTYVGKSTGANQAADICNAEVLDAKAGEHAVAIHCDYWNIEGYAKNKKLQKAVFGCDHLNTAGEVVRHYVKNENHKLAHDHIIGGVEAVVHGVENLLELLMSGKITLEQLQAEWSKGTLHGGKPGQVPTLAFIEWVAPNHVPSLERDATDIFALYPDFKKVPGMLGKNRYEGKEELGWLAGDGTPTMDTVNLRYKAFWSIIQQRRVDRTLKGGYNPKFVRQLVSMSQVG